MRFYPSTLELVFHDRRGNLVERGALSAETVRERSKRMNDRFNEDGRQEFARVYQARQEKPAWFRQEEAKARRFVRSLGLTAATGAQVTIIGGEAGNIWSEWDEIGGFTQAQYDGYYGIAVRGDVAQRAEAAPESMAKLLVHELVHAAEVTDGRFYQYYDPRGQLA